MSSILLLTGGLSHGREEYDVANGFLVGHQHSQAINANAEAASGGHSYLQGLKEMGSEAIARALGTPIKGWKRSTRPGISLWSFASGETSRG